MDLFVIFLIILALLFDFLNGFNDAANSIATIVSTRVLSPRYAVIWAAFFSTTHTITGSIMGVGTLRRFTAVRRGVAGQIVWAWILTIPFSATISAIIYSIVA